MANGWDSYFQNLPPLSSDPSTLRRTSDSEGSLSQHLENLIGHHDFPGTVASHEAPATNSNFNTNYYSNPSVGNSNSDCVYQTYYKETSWQADGEEMEKDYLSTCGNGDIDFTTDELQTSETFPESFAADLQGLKQDCGILATSFLEDYSDVSSCSDADAGETRPSCKFMAGNLVSKPKKDDTIKHSSSEWLFASTGNMMFPTENPCPNMSQNNETLPSPLNVTADENKTECAQPKIESQENPVKSYAGHNQSSTTSNVTTTGSETVEERNVYDGCEDKTQMEDVEKELTQGIYSNISASQLENLTGDAIEKYPDGNEEEQIPIISQDVEAIFDSKQDHLDKKVRRKDLKDSSDKEIEGFDNATSTDGQDRNLREDEQDKGEVLKGERKDSDSLNNENLDKQTSLNPTSIDCQDENRDTDCQERKTHSDISQSSDPPGTKVSGCKDVTHEMMECINTLKSNSHDAESCLQLSGRQSYKSVARNSSCSSPAVMIDGLVSETCEKNEQSAEQSHSDLYLEPNGSNTDPSCNEPAVTSNGVSGDTGDKQSIDSCLLQNTSSTDIISCPENEMTSATSFLDPGCNGPGVTSGSLSVDTSAKDKEGAGTLVVSCLQQNSSSTDTSPCQENKSSRVKETTTLPTDRVRTSDSTEQSLDSLELCLQSNTASTDLNPCPEKKWTGPAKDINSTACPDQQQSLHESPLATEPQSLTEDFAENARESFEELATYTGEPSVPGLLYGEPLSREDSSCDTDEIQVDASQCENNSLARLDTKSIHSEGQAAHLKSSKQMRKRLQPVVILQTEAANVMSNSYHCTGCQHTTHNVDHLIEHHHCCHSMPNFEFCKTCDLYLMISNEKAEKHLCGVTKKKPRLPSDSSLKKKTKRYGGHKCIKCRLVFSKRYKYITHMRTHTGKTPYQCNGCGLYFAQSSTLQRHKVTPGRCKQPKLPVTNSDAVKSETKPPTQKDFVQTKISLNLPQKDLVKTKPSANLPQKDLVQKKMSANLPQKDLVQNKRSANLPQKDLVQNKPSANLPQKDLVQNKQSADLPQKDLVHNKPFADMPDCFVKLVDICKNNMCSACGKGFSSAVKAKKHFYNVHKGGKLAILQSPSTTTLSCEKSQKGENERRGKHKCPLCPRLFKYSYNRARHLRFCVKEAVFGGKEKVGGKYRCPLCHTTFTLSSNRYRHINTFCLRESVNRLAKEAQSRPKTEHKTLSKESEQKTQALPALVARKTAPRYKCHHCPAVFYHPSGKYRHMKKHELFKLTGSTQMIRYRNSVYSTMSKPAALSSTKTEASKNSLTSIEPNNSLSLSCHFCGKCFATTQSLKKHEHNHKGEKPYRCLECGKGFKRHAYLIGHKIVHQRRIQCTVCRKILPTIRELIQHRSTHPKRGMLQCPDCNLQFQYPAHLLRHLDRHKGENKEPQFEEKARLKPQQSLQSVKEDSELKPLQCSLCKEVFNDAQVLRKHCLTHISGSSSHQCPFCKHNFSTRRYLLRHMIKHTGDKPFSCTNCGKQFYRGLYLKLHSEQCLPAQTTHPGKTESKPKGSHQCSYCPRVFTKKIRLKNHHRGHKANSLLVCEKCGQYFGYTKLNQHRKNCEGKGLNTGVSPNGNSSSSSSQTSQDVHKMPLQSNATKLLQFKCPYCTHKYRFKSILMRHLVSHTGVQPYACVHCGHRYKTQTACLQHEAFCDGVCKEGQSKIKSDSAKQLSNMPTLRDTAQKPKAEGVAEFKCKFCTKTFMKPRNLRRHILTHNEVKPYRCKACDCCFSRYDHLKVHQGRCKGKRSRLEVCIPKISLEDVGKGWQSKFGIETAEKQETFECEVCSRSFPTQSKLSRHNTLFHVTKLFKCHGCGSSFSHEKTLKKHRKMRKCRKVSKETNASPSPGTNPPAENVTKSIDVVRNRILQRIQPHFNKKYKYECSYCPRAFRHGHQLGVHIRLHTGERPFACDFCDLRFIRKDYVQRHIPKCTKKPKQNKVLCDRCGRFFLQVKIANHKKSCTLPPSSSKSTAGQDQQSTSQSPPKGFSCAYCSSRFLLFSQLQEHFLNAHKMETMVPPVSTAPLQHHLSNIPVIKEEPADESCDKQVNDGANSICKLDAASDRGITKRFPCPECNMSFVSKAGQMGHMRVHTMEPPFKCKTCKRGFWNKSLLRNHYRKCRFGNISMKNTSKQSEVPLKAEIDFALTDNVLLFNESTETAGTGVLQTNFSCKEEVIDESSQHSEGNEVQVGSSKEKKAEQYQCSECDKSFTDGLMLISHLEDHGRQEQEKKRNTCPHCGRVCTSPGNLVKHLRTHGIERKRSCPFCNKIFENHADFESHKSCHDPNRPYACKLCCQSFSARTSLCDHYKDNHPDDVFTCQFCNKAYSVKKSLARHVKKWHQKEKKNLGSNLQERCNVQERRSADQSSSKISTTGESEEEENNGTEDSDSDSAPYFPCHVCGKTFSTSESLEDHQLCHLGEKPHECAECGRCFFQASQLQQHQRMHKSEFQCQACGRGFVSLFALRKHKHTHGKSRPYRCPKCDFSFTGPSQLAEHMSSHREESFPCDICSRVFRSKSSRAEHRKSHSKSSDHHPCSVSEEEHKQSASLPESSSVSNKELKYCCGICGERFRDREILSEHGCMAAEERPYSCPDCDKHFLHASHLKKHRATHQQSWSSSEYPCNQCNNSFSSSQQYLSHLNSHVDTVEGIKFKTKDGCPSHGFKCPVCHQCFASATELIGHFPSHPDSTYGCKICKITFSSESKLKEHEQRHLTSATEFECTECGQSHLGSIAFLQHSCSRQQQAKTGNEYSKPSAKTSLPSYRQAPGEEEEIDVTGEDFYYCPVCSMQFSSKSGLLEHQNKQHPNEKPFKCELCGKSFAVRRYLREHVRRHRQKSAAQSAEIKIRCTQCHTEFSTPQELNLHMRVHPIIAVGQHRCDMCYKSFSQLSLLKQHQESHVGQVVYECDECDKAFAFPHLLEEHQLTHAGSAQ
ncbi:zinc finger protein 1035 [Sparus aurata]|uniref:zinc finger protein 1035 n=1 Tax=Sparus aurata TaxID=8175 RepID=UPI0011C17075|nr:uncharacterized protein LOC115567082 [Sparus aurata]